MTKATDSVFPITNNVILNNVGTEGEPKWQPEVLTKREYLAAMAMQGLMAKEGFAERMATEKSSWLLCMVAKASVRAADALIEELNTCYEKENT